MEIGFSKIFSGQSLLPSFSAGAGAFARSAGSCVRGRGSGVRARRSQQDLISQKASLGEPARPKKRVIFCNRGHLCRGEGANFSNCAFSLSRVHLVLQWRVSVSRNWIH